MPDDFKYIKKIDPFNDDIPYEVRMKYIIDAYRKEHKRIDELNNYAKGLEEENCLLTKKLKEAEAMLAERRDDEATIKKMQMEINQLKGAITKRFPKRVIKMRDMKKKVMSLTRYIYYLQTLLKESNIPYKEREVTPSRSESIDFENLDIFAVRDNKGFYGIDDE